MNMLKKILIVLAVMTVPSLAMAQTANPAPAPVTKEIAAPVVATPAAAGAVAAAPAEATAPKSMDGSLPGYTPMKPTEGIGMPKPKEIDFQEQFSDNGQYAKWINNAILLPIITIISLFVLGLLLWVIVRFNRRANPVPSKTTHNTFIEIVWTLVPVLILLGIAYPSLDLLAKQFKPAPADAVTVKVTGYQWYWGYSYPDHGGFEVVSNMLKDKGDVATGERFRTDNDGPKQLAVDNRMVVPAGVPLRIQTTAADVIHAFAVPSLWFKLDAVPGRLNEKSLTITKPGVYFGQCSELCGARHGFMPIAVEALPPEKFAAWVKAQGGQMPGEAAAAAAPAPAAATTPSSAAPAAAVTVTK
ncbi:cytochrome c oxidase subunit II [Sphingorhabdus sp. IMCC26285]|uniref:Cytochrome c oxidase subunit 2 n=1 Tax=Sphingorhabdus profundilacus TaxID=2509718 RepID=A0A6I4LXV8_9SPHN|nr:cytochrome c oxidase subunit II [Sphingorhabdus profundilacus]MVZ98282.1 cytochrome c oxidase subunit II [Sphingorhabdus profundilacus]